MIDRLPVPFGLVRYGVAPDHHSIRSIRNTLERTLDAVRRHASTATSTIGRDLTVDELRASRRRRGLRLRRGQRQAARYPGRGPARQHRRARVRRLVLRPPRRPPRRPNRRCRVGDAVESPALFTTALRAVVVGVGNVALDVARVLVKSARRAQRHRHGRRGARHPCRTRSVTDVHVLGRRGPAYTSFTTKELRELGQLAGLDVILDPADLVLDDSSRRGRRAGQGRRPQPRRLAEWAGRPRHRGRPTGSTSTSGPARSPSRGTDRVTRSTSSAPRSTPTGTCVGRGEPWTLPAQLVVRSVGYRGRAAARRAVRRQHRPGPARRGPGDPRRGVLGGGVRDRLDQARADRRDRHQPLRRGGDGQLAAGRRRRRPPRARVAPGALADLLAGRGIHPLDLPAWHRIDAAEIGSGSSTGGAHDPGPSQRPARGGRTDGRLPTG